MQQMFAEFESELKNKLIRNIHRDKQAELTEATKQRLIAEAEKENPNSGDARKAGVISS